MAAPLGFQALFEIDTNPGGTASWQRVGAGMDSVDVSNNDKVEQEGFLDGNGGDTSTVTGFQHILAFSGKRRTGDPAQDWIMTKMFSIGDSRVTQCRSTGPDGTVITGPCTLANISPPSGDANGQQTFSFEIHMNGKPTKTDPQAVTALTSTVAAGGTAGGTTKFTATPTAGNKLAYLLLPTLVTPKLRAYVDANAYNSGDVISGAAVGLVLHQYELDVYNHVVKFASKSLISGDITA